MGQARSALQPLRLLVDRLGCEALRHVADPEHVEIPHQRQLVVEDRVAPGQTLDPTRRANGELVQEPGHQAVIVDARHRVA